MHAYFELSMNHDGRYFFTARDATGGLVATSACYLTRQSAVEGMHCMIKACVDGQPVYYDKTLHAWRELAT